MVCQPALLLALFAGAAHRSVKGSHVGSDKVSVLVEGRSVGKDEPAGSA